MKVLTTILLIAIIAYIVDLIKYKLPFIQKNNNIIMEGKPEQAKTNYNKYYIMIVIIMCYIVYCLDLIMENLQIQ